MGADDGRFGRRARGQKPVARSQRRFSGGAGAAATSIPAMLRALAILLVIVGTQAAEALHFEQRLIEVKPTTEATTAEATFRFTNSSDRVVTITGTQTSCGCVVAEAGRTVYQPGERGEIGAQFTVGDAGGRQEKTIVVATDHPDEPTVNLTLVIELPILPTPVPAFVTWPKGSALEPRQVFIAIPEGSTLRFTEAKSSQKSITTALSEAPGGKAWLLTLTPTDTSAPANAMIELHTNSPRKLYVFASVVE